MTPFSPEAFLSTVVQGEMSTRISPVPIGVYTATIAKLTPRAATPNGNVPCDVSFEIDDANLKATLGRDKITTRQTLWLDFTESGALDDGKDKNTGLGKLREAVGQNRKDQPWSPSMLIGQPLRVKVEHQIDKNTGDVYDRVTQVSKL